MENNEDQSRTLSKTHKKKISRKLKGRTISIETKKKISEALKGNSNRVGKVQSESTKRKISLSIKRKFKALKNVNTNS